MITPEALKHLIQCAKEERRLDLGHMELEEIPRTLVLNYYNLLTSVAAEVFKLSNLEELKLNHNKLKEVPSAIINLSKLRKLTLEHNELTEVPREIGHMESLEELNVSGNMISEIPGDWYFLPWDGGKINITANPLISPPEEMTREFPQLRDYLQRKFRRELFELDKLEQEIREEKAEMKPLQILENQIKRALRKEKQKSLDKERAEQRRASARNTMFMQSP